MERTFSIFTTSTVPWRTGTSINPLLRGVELTRFGRVVFILPYLIRSEDRRKVYGNVDISSRNDQEIIVRQWIRDNCDSVQSSSDIVILWYDAIYLEVTGSIVQMSYTDLPTLVPFNMRDVAILEEPERLGLYHRGHSWKRYYGICIGIIHTNYAFYLNQARNESWLHKIADMAQSRALGSITRHNVDVSVHLSGATFPKRPSCKHIIRPVHGVRTAFTNVRTRASRPTLYFVGKAAWSKGYDILHNLYETYRNLPTLSTYGCGPHYDDICTSIRDRKLNIVHSEGMDHIDIPHNIFVNPSISEVLCTTTMEAIAMSRMVVIPHHVSNEHYMNFPNVFGYDPGDLSALRHAILQATVRKPRRLSRAQTHMLTWKHATECLMNVIENVIPVSRSLHTPCMWKFATTIVCTKQQLEELQSHRQNGTTSPVPDRLTHLRYDQCRRKPVTKVGQTLWVDAYTGRNDGVEESTERNEHDNENK